MASYHTSDDYEDPTPITFAQVVAVPPPEATPPVTTPHITKLPITTSHTTETNRDLIFLMRTLPWQKRSTVWFQMKKEYEDDPSKFILFFGNTYAAADNQYYATLSWWVSPTYESKLHVFYNIIDGRRKYTHITGVDAVRSPYTIVAV
jgi:hypothetical protein